MSPLSPAARRTPRGIPLWPGGPRDASIPPERMPDYGWLRLPPVALPPPTAWKRWGRNLALFLLTAASVFWVGGLHEEGGFSVSAGVRLVLGLLSILAAHEMGHYVACAAAQGRRDAPVLRSISPALLQPGRNARRLHPHPQPDPQPARALRHRRRRSARGLRGRAARARGSACSKRPSGPPSPEGPLARRRRCCSAGSCDSSAARARGHGLVLGPLGLAAWFGLLVTALNLMPIGQLDGGHVTYSLLPRARSPHLARRLVGLRRAHLLRPELDPVGRADARARAAPPADARRRPAGRRRRASRSAC